MKTQFAKAFAGKTASPAADMAVIIDHRVLLGTSGEHGTCRLSRR